MTQQDTRGAPGSRHDTHFEQFTRDFIERGRRAQEEVDRLAAEKKSRQAEEDAKQGLLFDEAPGPNVEDAHFEGPKEDDELARVQRLAGQMADVYDVIKDGRRRTLQEIADAADHPVASVSAQLRHLRKKRFGAFDVRKEHVGDGLYVYWMVQS